MSLILNSLPGPNKPFVEYLRSQWLHILPVLPRDAKNALTRELREASKCLVTLAS